MTRERRLQIVAQRAMGLAQEYRLFGDADNPAAYGRAMERLCEALIAANLTSLDLGDPWPPAAD